MRYYNRETEMGFLVAFLGLQMFFWGGIDQRHEEANKRKEEILTIGRYRNRAMYWKKPKILQNPGCWCERFSLIHFEIDFPSGGYEALCMQRRVYCVSSFAANAKKHNSTIHLTLAQHTA